MHCQQWQSLQACKVVWPAELSGSVRQDEHMPATGERLSRAVPRQPGLLLSGSLHNNPQAMALLGNKAQPLITLRLSNGPAQGDMPCATL